MNDISALLDELYRIVESLVTPKRVRRAAQMEIDRLNKSKNSNNKKK